ncbi:hypothetical protein Bca52824_021627 [Brassica carinata]|uniref:Response regulatory domain-containing protein n=1 Tax=Brassica carinata TaxID=52824 RepID=A0A8X7VEP4_BRACI|nr:hypothetical protein Bca52824_021627 [Brassica carinata]
MALAQSLNNQSSVLKINIMVVDDDPVSLEIMSRMLERSKYRDPSMEITVIAVRDAREALSTLKIQRNNIDLIITDYYMPGMNGLQLKQQITQQFGNFPVIVMSSDTNKKQESLACGALCFLPKPIKPTELPQIYQVALTYKRNGKSILRTEHNHKDTNISIPQQIQLLPEHANVSKPKKNKKFSSRSDSRSVNNLNGSCDSKDDGSREKRKRKSNGDFGDDVESIPQPSKKSKLTWSDYLHDLFLQAIQHIGLEKAVPKKILEFMDVSYLTRENVASHLQKYRGFLRKVAERGSLNMLNGRGMEPYHSNYTTSSSWYDAGLNNKSFYSKPIHGLGQSRLLSNTCEPVREPVRFNQMPYSHMNRLSTYEPQYRTGSNLTVPIKSNLSFSTQPLQNEGGRSFLEPTVMANKTGQTSQVLGFGQPGLLASNGNNFNNNTMSSYGSSTSNQPRISSYASSTPKQPGMNTHGSLTLNQPGMISYGSVSANHLGMSIQGSLTPSQREMSSYGSLTSNQPEMSRHGSLSPNQPGKGIHGSLTPTQPGMSSYNSLSLNQPRMSSHGSLTPTQQGMSSYAGSLTSNQPRMSSHGSLTSTQPGMSSYRSLTPTEPGMGNHESLSPNQPGMSSHESLTPTQRGMRMSSYGSLTSTQSGMGSRGSLSPNQPGMGSRGSLTTNQPGVSIYESLTPNQPGLNNEDTAYKPQPHAFATIQPNLEIPQLNNLSVYDDLGNINELPCDISNFEFDHDKQQEEVVSTNKFEIPTYFETELNQIFSLEEDGGWTFLKINQGHSNEGTSNTFAAPEMNDPTFNKIPNHVQEQDVPDFDWSLLDLENLANENDFMDSMFTNDMN